MECSRKNSYKFYFQWTARMWFTYSFPSTIDYINSIHVKHSTSQSKHAFKFFLIWISICVCYSRFCIVTKYFFQITFMLICNWKINKIVWLLNGCQECLCDSLNMMPNGWWFICSSYIFQNIILKHFGNTDLPFISPLHLLYF